MSTPTIDYWDSSMTLETQSEKLAIVLYCSVAPSRQTIYINIDSFLQIYKL